MADTYHGLGSNLLKLVDLGDGTVGLAVTPYQGAATPADKVQGTAATGAAVSGNPVYVGGNDGTNVEPLAVDTSGRLKVIGAAAAGAAIAGNPILAGGSDGTLARALLLDTSGRPIMVGAAANAATVAGNPVLVGGSDGTNAYRLLTDTAGRQAVIGGAAAGAAIAGNPVLMGGSDGTNARALLTDTSGRAMAVGAAANAATVTGNPVLVAGSDGTNAYRLLTDTSGRQAVIGAAAAGAAIAGNPVLIAGTDATNARSLLTDTTGRLRLADAPASGVLSATGSVTLNPVMGASCVGVYLTGNTGGSTYLFEATIDGSTFFSVNAWVTGTAVTSTTASSGQWVIRDTGGFLQVRVRCSVFVSGATTITLQPGLGAGSTLGATPVVGAAAAGVAPVGNPVLIAGTDASLARTLLTDTSGRLGVIGAAAAGAAIAGNPVLVGGSDATNARALLTDTGGRLIVDAAGGTNATDGAVAGDYIGPTSAAGAQLRGWNVLPSGVNAASTFDRLRTANGASNTTGTGLLGAGLLAFDGTNYQTLRVDSSSNLNLRVSLNSAGNTAGISGPADAQANATGLNTRSQTQVYNGATWDLARSANGADATTGTGLAGVNNLLFDGTNFQRTRKVTGSTGAVRTGVEFTYARMSTNTTTTIKSGAGVLHSITINTAGAAANTATVYDNTAGSGTIIAVIDTTSLAGGAHLYDVAFATGLTIVTATGTAPDMTISYQ